MAKEANEGLKDPFPELDELLFGNDPIDNETFVTNEADSEGSASDSATSGEGESPREEQPDEQTSDEQKQSSSAPESANEQANQEENPEEKEKTQGENSAPESQEAEKKQSILERAGGWAQEHLPEWAYKVFWGTVKFIGKVVRAIVFGNEYVTERAARSFERTMEAEEFKAKQAARQTEAHKEAAEATKEATQESRVAQSKQKDSGTRNQEVTEVLSQEKDLSANQEKPAPDIHKVALDTIHDRGFKIAEDPSLEGSNILKLSRVGKDGKEKECFVNSAILSETDSKNIRTALTEAAAISSAQRFLSGSKLTIAAIGDNSFIVERPGGASFAYDREMMKENLAEVVRLFRASEKQDRYHKEELTEDMKIPLTTVTVAKIIENLQESQAKEQAQALHENETDKQNTQPHTSSQETPEASVVHVDLGNPQIIFKDSKSESISDPYKGIKGLGYSVNKLDDSNMVTVTSKSGTNYLFEADDPRLKKPGILNSAFRAMEKMGQASGSVYEQPYGFDDVVNRDMKDVLSSVNLVMAAEENNGDTIYVFKQDLYGTKQEKSWTLSQSALAAGDATELAKIIFEIENDDLIKAAQEAEVGDRARGVIASEAQAAAKAIGIVAAMRYASEGLSSNAPAAFADIITSSGIETIVGTTHFSDNDTTEIAVSYGGTEATIVVEDIINTLDSASCDLRDGIKNTKDDIAIATEYMKEPSDELDHSIGLAMITSEEIYDIPAPELVEPSYQDPASYPDDFEQDPSEGDARLFPNDDELDL